MAAGFLEAFGSGLFLLVAITRLDADKPSQALIATGGSTGLLLGPVVVAAVRRLGWRVQDAMAVLHFLGALSLAVAAIGVSVWQYSIGGVLALAAASMAIPLATQYYQQNYTEAVRGRLFAIASTIRLGVAALVAWLAGEVLTKNITDWRLLPATCSVAMLATALILSKSPGHELEGLNQHQGRKERSALGTISLLWKDKAFAWLIAVWMLMGFGNLMMVPLRVKYLVEPQYGIMLDEARAALIVGVVPGVVFFLTTWWMGRLFDRLNFFLMRTVLNLMFLSSILVYFNSTNLPGLVLGSVLLGLAFSGGNIAWSLWVTKVAPAHRVADYMSVHTFMTGLRGLVAPALGVWLAANYPMGVIVLTSAALIGISTLMLGPELQTFWRRRAAQPVENQITE